MGLIGVCGSEEGSRRSFSVAPSAVSSRCRGEQYTVYGNGARAGCPVGSGPALALW